MDESYLQNMREIIEWRYLKYDSKLMNSKFLQKWLPVKSRYAKIQYLCTLYNSIVRILQKHERLLLENAINDVKNSINLALPKCTWAAENIDKIYAEWLKNILLLKDVVQVVKTTDTHIRSSCEAIAKFLLIKGTSNVSYSLKEFKEYLASINDENLAIMKELSGSVLSDLYVLHRKAKYGEVTPRHWTPYLTDIIETFKKCLVRNIRASLTSALRFFYEDCPSDTKTLLHVDVELSQDNLIVFVPDASEINTVLSKIISITNENIYSTDEFTKILTFGEPSKKNEKFIGLDDSVTVLTNAVKDGKVKLFIQRDRISTIYMCLLMIFEISEIKSGLENLDEFKKSLLKVERISRLDEILKTLSQDNTHEAREQLESAIRWYST